MEGIRGKHEEERARETNENEQSINNENVLKCHSGIHCLSHSPKTNNHTAAGGQVEEVA